MFNLTEFFTLNKNQKPLMVFLMILIPGYLMAQEKTPITSADQLPVRTISWDGEMLEHVYNDEYLSEMRRLMRQRLLSDLAEYDIQDNSTLTGYYQNLLLISFTEGNYQEVPYYLEQVRQLIEKESERLLTGNFVTSYIEASRKISPESDAFPEAFQDIYLQKLSVLPIQDIREDLEAIRGNLQLSSQELIETAIQGQIQPMLDAMGAEVPESIGMNLISISFTLRYRMPLRDQLLEVYDQLLSGIEAEETINIWEDREVVLEEGLSEVIIGIWDSGVDMNVFAADNRWINQADPLDGEDNDGNGFIDDYYGIAYNKEGIRTTSVLLPAEGAVSDLARVQRLAKGSMDLQAAINSEEATELRMAVSELDPESYTPFMEEISFYSMYSHGTHVAGISQAGNPAAKIMAARLSWSHRVQPDLPTLEQAHRTAQLYRDVVAYFQAHKVKVVNMSWRYNAASYEAALTAHNTGGTPEERKALANQMFEIEKTALYQAIASAQEILFVAGSGNENNDADFAGYIPAGFDLPNLITIGAVDSEGKKTSFTTEGQSVDFYANGYEVESFVPGGDRMKFSGTSMASPQVANLAAKLLAIDPDLSPETMISLIRRGATASEEDPNILLIHPKASLDLLK